MKQVKRFAGVLLIASLLVTAAGCGASLAAESAYEWPRFVTILGASAGGNAILSLNAVAQVLSDNTPATWTAQVTPGAAQNMYLLAEDEGRFAWGHEYYIYQANNGINGYEKLDLDMSVIMTYSVSSFQIAVAKNAGINNMQDLKGKRVVVGAQGGGTEAQNRNLCRAIGLFDEAKGEYLFNADYSGVEDGMELLRNGQADATLLNGAVPFAAISELFVSDLIKLIPFTAEEQQQILDADIGLGLRTIPAGSYEGRVTEDLPSVGAATGIICKTSEDEELVYQLTKTLCENWETLGSYMELFKGIQPKDVFNINTKYAQLHPGAVRYYKEMGWMK